MWSTLLMKPVAISLFWASFCFKPSVSSVKVSLEWHLQECRNVRDTQAEQAESRSGIRECIWHQISSGRSGPEYADLSPPSE
uniref:Secreted protein n=1 Tax=Arundo donax TaxID=35708 RepID=A0A0A8Z1X4_ARUDO